MQYIYSDGGRSRYFKGLAGDCVTRAIANATGEDYREIYDAINKLAKSERRGTKKRGISSARNGVYKTTERKYLNSIGWSYKPLVKVGDSTRYHLTEEDIELLGLERGLYILQIRKHLTVIKAGVIYDMFNPSEDYYPPTIYGYYYKI